MKKTFKKAMALTLGMATISTAMFSTACGISKKVDLEGKLVVGLLSAGYGEKFMTELLNEYQKLNPKVEFYVDSAEDKQSKFEGELKAGPKGNATDIYFIQDINFNKIVDDGAVTYQGVQYDCLLEDLTDTYNAPITYNNETQSIKEKMLPVFEEYFSKDMGGTEKYYSFPWASAPCGIMYNTEMFTQHGWTIPETTDELLALVQTIYNECVVGVNDEEKIYPLVWAGGDATTYWQFLEMVWQAQYDGIDGWKQFWSLEDAFGNYSADAFGSDSRLHMLEVMDELLTPEYCVPNSDTINHSTAQINFLDGRAAMMVNGSWLLREMEKNYTDPNMKIAVMKTPVLSAAKEKWEKVSAEKYQEIANLQFTLGTNLNAAIPAYADQKEVAKDFLKFIASDTGIAIYMKYAKSTLPFKTSIAEEGTALYNELPYFVQSLVNLEKQVTYVVDERLVSPVYYKTGLYFFPGQVNPEPFLFNGTKTADTLRTEQWTAAKSTVNTYRG